MKSKIWPQRPRKWPLDLNDLGRGSVDFFKKYIFEISGSSWEKWAIGRPWGQNFHLICPQRRGAESFAVIYFSNDNFIEYLTVLSFGKAKIWPERRSWLYRGWQGKRKSSNETPSLWWNHLHLSQKSWKYLLDVWLWI